MEVAIMTSETIRKLQEMRLSVMAKTYLDQMDRLEDYANMSFDERFSLIDYFTVSEPPVLLNGTEGSRQ